MMFRDSPNGKSVMLIRGQYSKDKGRGVQKTVGSLAADGSEAPSPELLALLTADEQVALSAELQRRLEKHASKEQVQRIRLTPASLQICADAIESACSGDKKQYADKISSASEMSAEAWASECWKQIIRVERAMRKLGFQRSKFAPKTEEQ